jgi:ABC-2 type transport system ATP-binding protein
MLILDEPTNGVDIPSKSQFRKIIANAVHEERTFIISTHQVRDMENLIDPIIILDEGKIIFYQDYEQISKKLSISKETEMPDSSNVVYYESSLGGYTVVKENTSSKESWMNLEILFNAVVGNREKINGIFKS